MAYQGLRATRKRTIYGLCEMYRDFCLKHYKDTPVAERVTYIEYSTIVHAAMAELMKRIIEKSEQVSLPEWLGHISFRKYRVKNFTFKSVDWQATRRLGKRVYHNDDTFTQFRYRFYWDKVDQIQTPFNLRMYEYKSTKPNRAKVAYNIINRVTDYEER